MGLAARRLAKIDDYHEPAGSRIGGRFARAPGGGKLPPVPKDHTRLYRGDAQQIDQFDIGRTSEDSLLGQGIYLTDSARIAGDYQGKGAAVFKYEGKPPVARQDVIDAYLRRSARTDFNDAGKPITDTMESMVRYQHSVQVTPAALAAAKAKFKADNMQVRVNADGTARVFPPAAKGSLSVVDVPDRVLRRTLNADAPIKDEVVNAVAESVHSKHVWPEVEAQRRAAANGEDDINGNGIGEPTFRSVYGAVAGTWSAGGGMDAAAQSALRRSLMEQGYSGIKYAGGVTMGGASHTAYVLWNTQHVNQHRIAKFNEPRVPAGQPGGEAEWRTSPKAVTVVRVTKAVTKFNPNHAPAGGPDGGQFTSGVGGGGLRNDTIIDTRGWGDATETHDPVDPAAEAKPPGWPGALDNQTVRRGEASRELLLALPHGEASTPADIEAAILDMPTEHAGVFDSAGKLHTVVSGSEDHIDLGAALMPSGGSLIHNHPGGYSGLSPDDILFGIQSGLDRVTAITVEPTFGPNGTIGGWHKATYTVSGLHRVDAGERWALEDGVRSAVSATRDGLADKNKRYVEDFVSRNNDIGASPTEYAWRVLLQSDFIPREQVEFGKLGLSYTITKGPDGLPPPTTLRSRIASTKLKKGGRMTGIDDSRWFASPYEAAPVKRRRMAKDDPGCGDVSVPVPLGSGKKPRVAGRRRGRNYRIGPILKPVIESLRKSEQYVPTAILKSDLDQHLVVGWASVLTNPDGSVLVDLQDDAIDEHEMVLAAYGLMQGGRILGKQHQITDGSTGRIEEHFVLTSQAKADLGLPASVPVGWLIAARVHDEPTWQEVKDGTFQGFSIGGTAIPVPVR